LQAYGGGGVQRFDERVLCFDVRVPKALVKPVCGVARGTGAETHHRTPSLSSPSFSSIHQRPANAQSAMVSVHNEAADHDERFCIDVFSKGDMDPPNDAAVHFCDEKPMIVPRQNPRHSVSCVSFRKVVPELCRQMRDLARI
jgi:hypothetical protein